MFKVVASDLDGTLLTPQHTLSSFTKQTLQAIRARDIHFIFATGRHHVDVARMSDNMEIDAFMITSNGAKVHDTDGNLIFSRSVDPKLAPEIAQFCKDDPIVYTHVFQGDNWLVNREDNYSLSYFHDTHFTYQLFDPLSFNTDDISKIYFTICDDSNHHHLVDIKNRLTAIYGNKISIAFSTLNCLELMGENVSKGHALQNVVERLGFTLSDSIAFGDGMNDLEMLTMAGKGCLMQNANKELIKQLPHLEIIGSNADDAVPHYLQRLFLQNH